MHTLELLSLALPSAPNRVRIIAAQLCHIGVVNCCRQQAALDFFVTPSLALSCMHLAVVVVIALFMQSKRAGATALPRAAAVAAEAVIDANLFACFDFYARHQRRSIYIFFLFFFCCLFYCFALSWCLIFLRRAGRCQLLLATTLIALRKIKPHGESTSTRCILHSYCYYCYCCRLCCSFTSFVA